MDALNISRACDYLMGKTNRYTPKTVSIEPGRKLKEKEMKALEVIAFFVTDYMNWTPLDAVDHLTNDIVECFGLMEFFKYVIIDDNMRKIDKNKPLSDITIKYILSKAFPDVVIFDEEEGVIDVWDAVQNGDITKWPSKFFSDENGTRRRMIFFKEFLRRYISVNEKDLYEEFKKSAAINNELRKRKLFYVFSPYYVQPIDLLHEYLQNEDREDEFLYVLYKYENICPISLPVTKW